MNVCICNVATVGIAIEFIELSVAVHRIFMWQLGRFLLWIAVQCGTTGLRVGLTRPMLHRNMDHEARSKGYVCIRYIHLG